MLNTWEWLRPYSLDNGDIWWPMVGTNGPTGKLQGAMHGRRSDGENFFYMMVIEASANEQEKGRAIAETTLKLQPLLTCGCRAKAPCSDHNFLRAGALNEGDSLSDLTVKEAVAC